MNELIEVDKRLFLIINGFHNATLDFVMFWASNKFIWVPLYLFLLFQIYKNYKHNFLIILIITVLIITVSDQISVRLFKNCFERLRPCHDLYLQDYVRILNNHCGGKYGFISSHASNTFAIAIFSSLLLKKHLKYIAQLLVIWAVLVSYSRIYLGVHFPADVIVGAIVGSIVGFIFYCFYKKYEVVKLKRKQN